jgi:hypothetical protein
MHQRNCYDAWLIRIIESWVFELISSVVLNCKFALFLGDPRQSSEKRSQASAEVG